MKKIILLFIFACIFTVSNVYAITYKDYKVGDLIEYNGDKYYVIENSGNDEQIVSTIKAEPLTVDEINSYKNTNHINVNTNESIDTAYNMNGYGAIAYYSDYNHCGYYYFSQDSGVLLSIHIPQYDHCALKYENGDPVKNSSDIKYIVDAWASDKLSDKDLMTDEYGDKYRLLSDIDLINFKYEKNNSGEYVKTSKTPDFVYDSKYSYWIRHEFSYEDKEQVDSVGAPISEIITIDRAYIDNRGNVQKFDGNLSTTDVTVFDMHAIRPIVNFKKSAIKVASNNISLGAVNYKIGDEIEYKNNKYYVIRNASEKDQYLYFVKKIPLTVDEVNLYGKGYINRKTEESSGTTYNNNGYGGLAFYSRRDCRENYVTGCTVNYNTSDIKHIVDAWANANFENNELVNTRLLNSEDFIEFGYDFYGSSVNSNRTYNSTSSVFDFLLDLKDAWTLKPYNDYNSNLLVLSDNANLITANVYDYKYLIYPVIIIKNPGYVVVKSPNTKLNNNNMLKIGGSLLLIACASILSYVVYSKVRKSHVSI